MEPKTAQQRKKDSIDRKKKAGLQRLEFWLDELTLEKLDELCRRHGYESPADAKQSNNDVLSNVVGYCIRKAAKCRGIDLPGPRSVRTGQQRTVQEVHRLYQMIKHRRQQGDSSTKIASFLNECNYIFPLRKPLRQPTDSQQTWTRKMVEELEDEINILSSLEKYGMGSTSSKTSSKRKP